MGLVRPRNPPLRNPAKPTTDPRLSHTQETVAELFVASTGEEMAATRAFAGSVGVWRHEVSPWRELSPRASGWARTVGFEGATRPAPFVLGRKGVERGCLMALPGSSRTSRRSTIVLVIALLMVVGVVAAAGAAPKSTMKVEKVTGTYSYYVGTDIPRTVSVNAHGTDPVKGTWTWTMSSGTYSGPVTCLHVSGDDAWLAGPFWDGTGAVFMWVHDGGTPGTAGDTAFTWGADPGETLGDMEALCEDMVEPPWDFDPYGLFGPFPVVSGNLNVWDAP